jgi:hypothetical protein
MPKLTTRKFSAWKKKNRQVKVWVKLSLYGPGQAFRAVGG